MVCCTTRKSYSHTPSHFHKYPCRISKEEGKPCSHLNLESLIAGLEKPKVQEKDKQEIRAEKRRPCENVKPPSKKKFQQIGFKQICAMAYSRKPSLQDTSDSSPKEFQNLLKRQRRESHKGTCPRELSDYEKSLWIPLCRPPEKPMPCRDAIDETVCVFCLESLYTHGYIHELFEKVPLIKKQSGKYGDEIAWRIGIRSRIIVHKSCYNSYIDTFSQKGEDENEVHIDLGNEEVEDSEDLNCEGEEKEEEEESVGDDGVGPPKKQGKEGQNIGVGGSEPRRKQHFCLGKIKLPTIDSGHPCAFPFSCGILASSKHSSEDWKQIYLSTGVNAVREQMGKFKPHGLVADLWPNIRLLQLSGHFLHEYHDDNSAMNVLLRKIYSSLHLVLVLIHFAAIMANMAMESDDVNVLAANSITVLFFTHCITKFCYFALRRQKFYRTLAVWDTQNSHPLFAESHARHRAIAITKSRRLLMITVIGTLLTVVGWTGSTFFGESTKSVPDPENTNDTIKIEIPRLMLRAWYPWDASSGSNYMFSFVYQLYWLVFTLFHANLVDLLFCSWLIFACEQLLHVKEIMKPLIDLSSSLDTYNPGSSDLFKAAGAISDNAENFYDSKDERQINIRSIYSNMRDFGMNRNTGALNAVNGIGPNGLSKKHEMLVRSAIKYWVERHKHIVRYVGTIGDAYGLALLLHMLTSTITLTLLAYQATKIEGMDLYAMAVLGYLFYSLAQVFAFCIYGNQLIEESSSVMEAAYSCQWYDGSEEAKTFVQIVCQQCQKALSISGAKFFTVSLDLFASVLGAVVTYFMVLVQLK